jgi:hypothetical protein
VRIELGGRDRGSATIVKMEKTIDIYKDKLGDPTLGTTLPTFLPVFLSADIIFF